MSKMDGLRAMREARYEQRTAGTTTKLANPAKPAPAAKVTKRPTDQPAESERLCGHRAISGRTCTREHGHAAKSHRYA